MRFLYPRLLLIALCLAVAPSAMAASWDIDGNNGDDGNDCKTPQTACATIGHAISLAASGDTIKIAAATYQENLSIPFKLTLTGANAATTIVDGTNTANVFTVGAGISPYFLRTQCKLRRHRQSQLDDNHDLDLLQQLREQ